MDISKKTTYRARIRYKVSSFEKVLLVEAESMESALEICREYLKNTSADVLELTRHTDILVMVAESTIIKS